jgi:hypothetical protein
VFALTFKVAGVEPLAGVTVSQDPPDAAAVILNGLPLLAIERFWVPVAVLPVGYVNDTVPGETVSEAFPEEPEDTVSVTETFCGELEAPEAVTVTDPV